MADALFKAGDRLVSFPHRGRPVRGTAMRELTTVTPTSSDIVLAVMPW
jgi:hypothetical protein